MPPSRMQPVPPFCPLSEGPVSVDLAKGAFPLLGDVRFGSDSWILVAVVPVPKPLQNWYSKRVGRRQCRARAQTRLYLCHIRCFGFDPFSPSARMTKLSPNSYCTRNLTLQEIKWNRHIVMRDSPASNTEKELVQSWRCGSGPHKLDI